MAKTTEFTVTLNIRNTVDSWSNISGDSIIIGGYATNSYNGRSGNMDLVLASGAADPMFQTVTGVPAEFMNRVRSLVKNRQQNVYAAPYIDLTFRGRELVSIRADVRIAD